MKKLFFFISLMLSISASAQFHLQDTVNLKLAEVSAIAPTKTQPVTQSRVDSFLLQNWDGTEPALTLRKLPSVTFYSDAGNGIGYTYWRLRGIDQTRINTTLNGVPLNEPEDQGAYFSNLPGFMGSVTSATLVRGVGSSSFGAAQFGGALHLENNYVDENSVTLGFGSYGTFSGRIRYGVENKNLKTWGTLNRLSTQGFRDNAWHEGYSFIGGTSIQKKGRHTFHYMIGNSQNGMAWLPSTQEDLDKNISDNPLDPDEKDNFTQGLLMYNYSQIFKNSQLSTSFWYNGLKGIYGVQTYDEGGNKADLLNFNLRGDWFGNQIVYKHYFKNVTVDAGSMIYTYSRNHFMMIEDFEAHNNIGIRNEASGFTKVQYQKNKFLAYLDVNLRYTNFNYQDNNSDFVYSRDWTFLNRKAGVNYQFHTNIQGYAFIGKAYREPTRLDMFTGDDHHVDFMGNENIVNIQPEEVLNFESGIKTSFKNFRYNINYFRMNFVNEILPIGVLSLIGQPIRLNIPQSYRYGLENEIAYLSKNTQITAAYSAIVARITEFTSYSFGPNNPQTFRDKNSILTPSYVASLSLQQRVFGNIHLTVDNISQGEMAMDNENTIYIPGFSIWSSGIIYKLNNFEVTAKAQNIFNSTWYTGGYFTSGPAYFRGFNRNFWFQVTKKF